MVKKSILHRAKEVLQEYHFRQRALNVLSFILLGFVVASTVTIANSIYICIFLLQGLIMSLGLQGLQRTILPFQNGFLLVVLTVELVFQYCNFISLAQIEFTVKENYNREVQGVLLNKTSFVVFGLKVASFIIEALRCQYSIHLTKFNTQPFVKTMIKRVIQSHSSYSTLVVPLNQFLFCFTAIIFVLLHPSAIYAPFLPVLMLAFFSSPETSCGLFRVASKVFTFFTTFFLACLYVYQLYHLHAEDGLLAKWKNSQNSYLVDLFGMKKNSMAMRQLFPSSYEFLIYLTLVSFCYFANQSKN